MDRRSDTDVLIFVEDPGAANFVADLPVALKQAGLNTLLVADGAAVSYLSMRDVLVTQINDSAGAETLLADRRPKVIVVGTSENLDTFGFDLIQAAKKMGIQSVGVVDAYMNYAFRFRGRSPCALTYAPDWLLVPDLVTEEAYIKLGYDASRISVVGHPHYDHLIQKAQQLVKKDHQVFRQAFFSQAGARPVVVFVAEGSTGLDELQYQRSDAYTLFGRGQSVMRTDIVIEEFLDAVKAVDLLFDPYLVLRLHPKNTPEEFGNYLNEFDQVSQNESAIELVFAADYVVGMTSMLLLEAVILGRPTLSIVPRAAEREWLPGICIEHTTCVETREKLRNTLPDFFIPLKRQANAQVNGALQSLGRTVEFLKKRISNT